MEPAKEIKSENTSTEGMEHIFAQEEFQEQEQILAQEQEEQELLPQDIQAVELVPVSSAAEAFNKTRRYISKLAKDGRILAEKNDKNQWMVELESVRCFFQEERTKERTVPEHENKGNRSVREILEQERIKELKNRNEELEQEVRNAHYRLGYLENEMGRKEEQIKLLEDRKHKT